ncbi:MAG: hypothetical protein WCS88_03020 [Patescibacteria group bacterium]
MNKAQKDYYKYRSLEIIPGLAVWFTFIYYFTFFNITTLWYLFCDYF